LLTKGQNAGILIFVAATPTAARRRLSNAERRTELLEAGIRLFSDRGVWDLSASELARQAGASKALLFHYFGSKRAYYVAVVQQIADRVAALTVPNPRLPLDMNLRVAVGAFVDFVEDSPAVYRLLRGAMDGDDEVRAIAERVRLLEVERIIEELGVAEPSAKLRTAIYGWIGFVETATLHWADHGGFDKEQLVEMFVGTAGTVLDLAREEV